MKDSEIHKVIGLLKKEVAELGELPIVTQMPEEERSPFQILVATVMSARTTDEVTAEAARRLFARAPTPEAMLKLSAAEISRLIYPVGFYRTKAKNILALCRDLVDKYRSQVPQSMDELLKLKGVGRKTANLVITLAFQGQGICVDTHVHRISNRLGYVSAETPRETEIALRAKLPKKYWPIYNTLLVVHGQNICRPISPFCSRCPVFKYCDRIGVTHSR